MQTLERPMTRRERRVPLQRVASGPDPECMIWTHTGTWLETIGRDGRRVSSFCGQLGFNEVEDFCRANGWHLIVRQSKVEQS